MKKIYIIALIFVCMFLVGCKSSDNERGITFRVNDGYFQWQYEGDTTWTNIISLEELNGQDGTPGVTPHIGENGNWWIGDFDTGVYAGSKNPSIPQTGEFEFAVNTDGESFYLSNYKGNDCIVIIPNSYQGYPITSIGHKAFNNNVAIEKINIPNSIKTIYSSSFSGAINLAEIEFEENSNLISIGDDAFSGCSSLTSITIPNSVTSIGSRAFSGCS